MTAVASARNGDPKRVCWTGVVGHENAEAATSVASFVAFHSDKFTMAKNKININGNPWHCLD